MPTRNLNWMSEVIANDDKNTLLSLDLHEEITVNDNIILRVMDGWIYTNDIHNTSVFVPQPTGV